MIDQTAYQELIVGTVLFDFSTMAGAVIVLTLVVYFIISYRDYLRR